MAIYINGQLIQHAYIGGAQARKCYVGGQLVFGGQQPAQLVALQFAIPSNSASMPLLSDMSKPWELIFTIRALQSTNEFLVGDSNSAYLSCTGGIAKCHGTTDYSLQYSQNTNKTVYDLNFHMQDPDGGSEEYDWMFLNVDWDGVPHSAGYQKTYSKVTSVYNTNPVAFTADGNIRVYSYDEYTMEKKDSTTKRKVAEWRPYFDTSSNKVVWKNEISGAQVVSDTDTPGCIYGAEELFFTGSNPVCYIYGTKAYSDKMCSTYYTAGTYSTSDGWEYVIASDGTYTKREPVVRFDGKIKGTATPSTTFTLAINGASKSVTSDASGYWEIDADSYGAKGLYNMAANTSARAALKTIDFSTFDFSKITGSCQSMLASCSELTTVTGLSGQDMSHVQNFAYVFQNCTKLTSIDLHGDNFAVCTTLSYLAAGCSALTTLNMTGVSTTSSLTNLGFFAQNCSSLKSVDLSSLTVTGVTNSGNNLARLFNSCTALETCSLPAFQYGHSAEDYFFNGCTSLVTLNVPSTFKYNVWTTRSSNLSRASLLSLLTAYSQNAPYTGCGLLKFHNNSISLVNSDTELKSLWLTAQTLGWSL